MFEVGDVIQYFSATYLVVEIDTERGLVQVTPADKPNDPVSGWHSATMFNLVKKATNKPNYNRKLPSWF